MGNAHQIPSEVRYQLTCLEICTRHVLRVIIRVQAAPLKFTFASSYSNAAFWAQSSLVIS